MRYEESVTLRDGRECVLRNACGADAQEVLDSFNLTHSQTDFLLTYPDENSYDVERERQYLTERECSPDEVELCAVVEGHVAGCAGIETVGRKEKVKHRAEFGISIERAYWGLGIGRALLKACIECARRAGYLQMELSVVADNASALSLYEKAGFVEYGRNPRGFRSRTRGWQEVILMCLALDG